MQKFTLTLAALITLFYTQAAEIPAPTNDLPENNFASFFEKAYQQYPSVPKGMLEAVAYTNSHFHHITHEANEEGSCVGLPKYYGVMGLVSDGKNYFRNNLPLVAGFSGITTEEILASPEKNILAYASAFSQLLANTGDVYRTPAEEYVYVLEQLSELPDNGSLENNYALNTHLYAVLSFLNNPDAAAKYGFPKYAIDLAGVFGAENLKVLSAPHIMVSAEKISDKSGNNFKGTNFPVVNSWDYAPALQVAAPTCNYSTGRSQAISAVTIHDVEGSYAGCISWFQNCAASVSAHYVVRSSDGQITQMVKESNTAWHVGSQNPYTIGIEHEGYSSQTGWYTIAMYNASAALCADICASGYGIPPLRTGFQPWMSTTYYNQSSIPGACTKIKGHQHYPAQTHSDPGPNWDWNYFYKMINPQPAATVYTAATGTIYDSGGAAGNYSDDERLVWTISPTAATSVTLTFNSFDTENTWDYLYVYNGTDVWAPLIGYYTGATNPGTLVANSGSMTLEFRSDCATPAAGWNASWSSNATTITPTNLAVTGLGCPSLGVNLTWQNSGAGWFVDVSDDPTFTDYYNKDVSSLTTIACPGGFANINVPTNFLAFQPSTTYYWRIWDGTSHTGGSPFTTPNCVYMDTSCSGSFDDTGGPSAAYGGNEDWTDIIQPGNATSVTINFTSFDLETNFDSLWIYDGLPNSNLVGIYTGTVSPGSVTAPSGMMSVRFKSDPFVNNAGWTATWTCTSTTGIDEQDNSNEILIYPNPFSTEAVFQLSPDSYRDFNLPLSTPELRVYDVFGRAVINTAFQTPAYKLERGDLASGMYFYEVRDGGKIIGKGKLIAE